MMVSITLSGTWPQRTTEQLARLVANALRQELWARRRETWLAVNGRAFDRATARRVTAMAPPFD